MKHPNATAPIPVLPPEPGLEKNAAQPLRLFALVLAAITFLLYANTINNGYVLDDSAAITGNALVKQGIAGIPQLLVTPYHEGVMVENNDTTATDGLYRPLSLVMFATGYHFFGATPALSHLINVLLFAACVALLFYFLAGLPAAGSIPVAFLAASLFACHPIHTEVVANIKSRDELLCFFFAFAALLRFRHYAHKGNMSALAGGMICYFLSLLAKETSVSFAAIIPLFFFGYYNLYKRRSIHICITSAVVVATFLALRFYTFSTNDVFNKPPDFIDNVLTHAPSTASRLATSIYILGQYLRLLAVPYPLISDYSYNTIPFVGFSNIPVLLTLAAYTALTATAAWRLAKKKHDTVAFAVLFFLLTIALFSNIVLIIGAAMAERFVFFASVGFCLAIAHLLWQWLGSPAIPVWKSRALIVIVPVCLIFSGITIARNNDWKDNNSLFTADVAQSPENARLWHAVGIDATTAGIAAATTDDERTRLMTEGIAALQRSVAIYPQYANSHYDLGSLFLRMQQYDSAEVHAKIAVALDPGNAVILNGLGYVYFATANYPGAADVCRRALAMNGSNPALWNNLAICHLQMKNYNDVIGASQKALALLPGNVMATENLARAHFALGDTANALKYEAMAQEKEPSFQLK